MALKEESTTALALQVLKAISKSVVSAVQLDYVPEELCYGEHLDLSKWTMILGDEALKFVGGQPKEFFHVDCTKRIISEMFAEFHIKRCAENGLLSLNINGAKNVTDFGLAEVSRNHPHLRHLYISGCNGIGDAALREVATNCLDLQTLHMPNCLTIEGAGLGAIADCCEMLIKFNAARCKNVQRWAFAKIFYKCNRLEEVDVSDIKEIGDNEIRILAESCPHLVTFIAKECPFLSDQSLLVISQNCPDIDIIDVSRTQMTFRITDVGLLALGQRSFSLSVLKLNGCEQVSDVGLTWLAEGCNMLEVLELSGCTKISDPGMRAIGNGCHTLTSLDIPHAKLVSDVGLASIATGCPLLKHLNVHALYLLADPKLGAPKKGEKAEAWQSIVGTASLAKFAPKLESLNVSGCFRLNLAIQRHLSTFRHMRIINLTGCNQVTTDAMLTFTSKCKKLEEVNFSDCGKAINNAVITSLASNNRDVRILILGRCQAIRGQALKAIATLDKLQRLEMSGCTSITDLMLLPICEVDRVVGLTVLSLSHNPQLTDTTIAWVAYGKQNIMTLSLKGTGITRQAIESVRDRFPYSDMTINDNFYGYWPKTRVDDRKLMNTYFTLTNGITKLQARQLGVSAKKRVQRIKEKRAYTMAILLIQKVLKKFHARMIAGRLRKERFRLNMAALRVTSMFWIAKAKQRAKERRAYLYQVKINKLATIIQRRYRLFAQAMHEYAERMAYEEYMRNVNHGATMMQSAVRLFFAKRRVGRIKAMREARYNLMVRKAFLIQRVFRGHQGRVRVRHLRVLYHKKFKLRIICAAQIQYNYRKYRTISIINEMIRRRRLTLKSCIMIQSVIRGALARLYVAEIKLEINEQLLDWAARKIQTRWFVKKALIEVKRLLAEQAAEKKRRFFASIAIQCAARARQARKAAFLLKEERIATLKLLVETEMWAIMKIQAFIRGCKGRRRFEILLREKKGKWKELFDEKKQKRFFYNQLTGEIRWRMPQDLLDLIPRPVCDNCSYYEAQVECALCNELFCTICWDQVHRGGRRRDHEFRSLYDYYGKRIDYGDGIFPCKWPTEVMQDEAQGWMLRVAPIRDPVAVYDDWEEYLDENDAQRPVKGKDVPDQAIAPVAQDPREAIPLSITGGVERNGRYKPLPPALTMQSPLGPLAITSGSQQFNADQSSQWDASGTGVGTGTLDGGVSNATGGSSLLPDFIKPKTFYFNRTTFETSYDKPQAVVDILEEQEAARLAQTQNLNDTVGTMGYYDEFGNWIEDVNTGYYDPSSPGGYSNYGTSGYDLNNTGYSSFGNTIQHNNTSDSGYQSGLQSPYQHNGYQPAEYQHHDASGYDAYGNPYTSESGNSGAGQSDSNGNGYYADYSGNNQYSGGDNYYSDPAASGEYYDPNGYYEGTDSGYYDDCGNPAGKKTSFTVASSVPNFSTPKNTTKSVLNMRLKKSASFKEAQANAESPPKNSSPLSTKKKKRKKIVLDR